MLLRSVDKLRISIYSSPLGRRSLYNSIAMPLEGVHDGAAKGFSLQVHSFLRYLTALTHDIVTELIIVGLRARGSST
jgi:hypothetical protein